MSTAYYMSLIRGEICEGFKVGGLPSNLPSIRPWSPEGDGYYGFLCELAVDGKMIQVPSVRSIQLYQPIDESADPTPLVGVVRSDGVVCQDMHIVPYPELLEANILFEQREDPEKMPELLNSLEVAALFHSKFGGVDPWGDDEVDKIYIGHIREVLADFNFGGMSCYIFYSQSKGRVVVELR